MSIFRKKVELYQIFDSEERFYITNSNKFVTYGDVVYTPSAIDRSKIDLKPEMEKNSVTITVDIDHPLAKRYLLDSVESTATIRIIENYNGDFYSLWGGRMVNTLVDGNAFNMVFENKMTKQLRSGAYKRYQRTCPYALYGSDCRVNKQDFLTPVEVNVIGRNGIKVLSMSNTTPQNYFSGGMVEIDSSGLVRYITKSSAPKLSSLKVAKRTEVEAILHSNGVNVIVYTRVFMKTPYSDEVMISEVREDFSVDTFTGEYGITNTYENISLYEIDLTLFNSFSKGSIAEGTKLKAYAGCDKTNRTCSKKFGNILNFGGFPFIPIDNPFSGTII